MAEDIKNLLLRIALPLAFPLAGSFISDLITKRGENRFSYTDTSDCSVQFDHPSYGSTCQEEEEQEMESTRRASRKLAQSDNACSTAGRFLISEFSRQTSNAQELMETAASGDEAEVGVSKVQDNDVVSKVQDNDVAMADGLATLKRLVSGLEERACGIETQFHDYCDMKEQESAYQKMQIMCLGMKLELLESRNQQLEAASVEIRTRAEEFAAVQGRLDGLKSKLKKMAKRRKQDSDVVGERILALDAKHALVARRCEEFELCLEEMKQLTLQLQEQKGANNEIVEVAVERSLRKLSRGRDLVDGLEALRDRWAFDMEEMIYLGWITAWLQHELLLSDAAAADDDAGGFGTVAIDGADPDPPQESPQEEEQELKKGETVVAEVAPSKEVLLCKAASSSSSSSASSGPPPRRSVEGEPPSCLGGFAAAGGGRPRLLRKLRGWAGGKGQSSKKACRIVGPCCQK